MYDYQICLVWFLKDIVLLALSQNSGIALSEVITSIEVEAEQQVEIPVFMMKDIKKVWKILNSPFG